MNALAIKRPDERATKEQCLKAAYSLTCIPGYPKFDDGIKAVATCIFDRGPLVSELNRIVGRAIEVMGSQWQGVPALLALMNERAALPEHQEYKSLPAPKNDPQIEKELLAQNTELHRKIQEAAAKGRLTKSAHYEAPEWLKNLC